MQEDNDNNDINHKQITIVTDSKTNYINQENLIPIKEIMEEEYKDKLIKLRMFPNENGGLEDFLVIANTLKKRKSKERGKVIQLI